MASVESDELDIDELVDNEDEHLASQFRKAADYLANKLLPQGVDNIKLLTLYGYYKQATEGACNVPKPSFFDFKGKSKWEAWKQLGDLSKDEAKSLYVETIKTIDPSFNAHEEKNEKEHWVKVSTMMKLTGESGTTLTDFIKEGNLEEVEDSISTYEPDELKTIVNKLDELGLASIHWAADSGHTNIVELLLKSGANINRQDIDGQTALHYAANCGHVNCVKFLLKKGANKNILDKEGNDPYNMAGDDEIKNLLKSS